VKKQLDDESEKYIQMKMDRFNEDFETFNSTIKEVILKKKLNEDIYQSIVEYIKRQLKML
jgi:translation initiation factor 2 alpha subunit (eIF-2alpha)